MKHLLLAATAALVASPALADMTVEIPFTAEIAGAPFACTDSYAGLGSAGTEVQFLDFRLFVSSANLIAADGTRVPVALEQDGAWQIENIALLDFEDGTGSCSNGTPQVNTTLRGTVPEGEYRGLEFEVGVPFDWNHGDPTTAPAPLNLTAMFWNWRGGYKFVKIEFSPTAPSGMSMTAEGLSEDATHGQGPRGWMLHLGSTQCAAPEATTPPSEACTNPNRIAVALPDFLPGESTVVIDPAVVVAGADLTQNTAETSPGCMSFPNDPDCNTVLPRLGLAFNAFPAEEQTLVSMR
ncbi:MAG TPA: metallo-mystery pair system four-Cys motif protein [Roseovarius sp.]|nr:metallo-mystery pair system four-Cys motif protein [Roseovarius sp.]